jgi:hypothetical protein
MYGVQPTDASVIKQNGPPEGGPSDFQEVYAG